MSFKKILCLLSFVVSQGTYSQIDIPVYSDYLTDNYYLLHPSMAGAANCAKVRLTARQQWFGNEDAPSLQTLSINSSVGESGTSAVGLIMFSDKNGYHSQKGIKATYAHHIRFSRNDIDLNRLSFGMNVGMTQLQLDETSFDPNEFDPIISGGIQSANYYNIDFGASYNFLDFYAHATVKNAIFKSRNIYTDVESENLRKYLLSAGYTFGSYDKFLWEPSVLFQMTELTKEKAIDANIKAYKNVDFGRVWAGLSYRRSFDGAQYVGGATVRDQKMQYITPLMGVNYKQFMFAYTYSNVMGDIKFDTGGFHQITLGFNFACKREKYDCNCPSVN